MECEDVKILLEEKTKERDDKLNEYDLLQSRVDQILQEKELV